MAGLGADQGLDGRLNSRCKFASLGADSSMFGKFFDTASVNDFAARVVNELHGSLPPCRLDDGSKQAGKSREQADERIRRLAETLIQQTPLNVYQKAKLGVRLGEALEGAGYPASFSKTFAYDVVTMVASAAAARR